jgi:hypothetical protein
MPTCNLAKNVHHAWSMQFGKKSIDLYDTITNDLIQTLIQQTWYKYYLMGRSKEHGLYNYELCLQTINWSGDL